MKLTAALLSSALIRSGQISHATESDPCGKQAGYMQAIRFLNDVGTSGKIEGDIQNGYFNSLIMIGAYVSNQSAEKALLKAAKPGLSLAQVKQLQGEARAFRESASKECNARD